MFMLFCGELCCMMNLLCAQCFFSASRPIPLCTSALARDDVLLPLFLLETTAGLAGGGKSRKNRILIHRQKKEPGLKLA